MLDRIASVPPCIKCGSVAVMENRLRIDLFGNWHGYWVCENGHRNDFQ